MIPIVLLTMVLLVRGPGLGSVAEQKRKLVPSLSNNSTRTVSEKESHWTWKYRMPPSGTSVVVLSPGSMMAGAVNREIIIPLKAYQGQQMVA